jgi:hypothetical protein
VSLYAKTRFQDQVPGEAGFMRMRCEIRLAFVYGAQTAGADLHPTKLAVPVEGHLLDVGLPLALGFDV